MLSIYNRSEAIETVYTYEEWLKEYNRRETEWKIKQRTEHLYYLKQRISGVIMAVVGIASPFILKDISFTLVTLPLGIFLLMTKEKVVSF